MWDATGIKRRYGTGLTRYEKKGDLMQRFVLVGLAAISVAITSGVCSGLVRAQAPSTAGLWLDHDGKAAIEIARCDRFMCGKIVWLKEPNDKDGKAWHDILNADQAKRTTPICGLPVIGDLKRQTNGEWTEGWIYDPEQGKRFNVEISLKDEKTLTIFAFDKDRALNEIFAWTRLADNAPRCK